MKTLNEIFAEMDTKGVDWCEANVDALTTKVGDAIANCGPRLSEADVRSMLLQAIAKAKPKMRTNRTPCCGGACQRK